MKSITSKLSIIILSLMASTFAFAEDQLAEDGAHGQEVADEVQAQDLDSKCPAGEHYVQERCEPHSTKPDLNPNRPSAVLCGTCEHMRVGRACEGDTVCDPSKKFSGISVAEDKNRAR